jgi:type VI protein secretion system component VasF
VGLFFTTSPLKPVLADALQDAIQAQPTNPQEAAHAASATADQIQNQVAGSFAWGRFVVAIAVLALIFVGCIYTAHDDKLQELYKVMTHGFELLLGIVLGLIGGEAAARR